jgi:hypothetical protein
MLKQVAYIVTTGFKALDHSHEVGLNIMTVWLVLLLCICVSGSNFGPETSYPV